MSGFSFKKFGNTNWKPGKYKARITDVKKKTSGTVTDEFDIGVVYTVVEGPMTGKVLHDTIYSKAFGFRLSPFMQAAGLDINREFKTADELIAYGIKEAKDRILFIDLENKEYNGKTYTNIKTWESIPTSISTAEEVMAEFDLKTDAAKELTDKLKESIKDEKGTPPSDEDDSPFPEVPTVDFNLDDFSV